VTDHKLTRTKLDRDGMGAHVNPSYPSNVFQRYGLPPGNVAVIGAGVGMNVREAFVDREDAVLIITALSDAVEAYDNAYPAPRPVAVVSTPAPAPLKKGDPVELVGFGATWDGVGTCEGVRVDVFGGDRVSVSFKRARLAYGTFAGRFVKRLTPEREAEIRKAAELAEVERRRRIDEANRINREETARKAEEQKAADRLTAHSLVPGDLVLIGEKPGAHRHGGVVDVHAAGRAGSVVDTTPFERDRGRVRVRYVTSFGVERVATIHVASFTRAKAVPA
jgi:hypothetical protein